MADWLVKNQILICVATAWAMAQIIKTLLYLRIEGEFKPERLIGSGGMPSSHSSTVCALTIMAFYKYGVHSFEFVISLVLAIIVMHDAMGVRLETGKQAKVINAMLMENPLKWKGDIFEQRLKELVGHTPLQVVCGAILGMATGLLMILIIENIR